MHRKRLLIIATLDTKGREAAYVKECAEGRGVKALIMDVGALMPPQTPPDITRDELAHAAGLDLTTPLAEKDRANAVQTVQTGGAILAARMAERNEIHGVIGLGGGTGTAIVTFVMRALPFGFPKVDGVNGCIAGCERICRNKRYRHVSFGGRPSRIQ